MEMSLSHSIGGSVEKAYMRSDLLRQRRALMKACASFVIDAA